MKHVLRRATTVAAALVLGVAAAVPAAAAEAGLSGTVTDDLGQPVSACLEVYPADDWEWIDSTCTEPDGSWALPSLPDGDYKLYVSGSPTTVGGWFDDAVEFDTATVVTAPATVPVVQPRGGTLTGTLTDQEGSPVAYADVRSESEDGRGESTSTWEDGTWSMLVRPGQHRVSFSSYPAQQWAYGSKTWEGAALIDVEPGSTTVVDDRLLPVATVSGTVTDEGGRPLENVCASLVDAVEFSPWDSAGEGCTDSEGHYSFVPWGDTDRPLTLFFQDWNEPRVYAAEFAGGSYSLEGAERVDVSAAVEVDATLGVGGVISGKAVTERKPNGLADVCPTAYSGRAGGQLYGPGSECSGADGTFRLTALPPGQVALLLEPSWRSGVSAEWYRDATSQATATLIAVRAGSTTTLKPEKFNPGSLVTGRVTDRSGQPVEGAFVYLEGRYPGRAGPGEGRFVAQTDADGRYRLVGPAGTYTPFVDAPWEAGLAPQWSGGAVTRATATPVTLRDFRTSTLDFTLAPASRISGRVVNADGSDPDANLYVLGLVYTETGDYIGDIDAWAEGDWRFFGSNLPAGRFRIKAEVFDMDSGEGGTVWFDGATTEAGATLVEVGPASTREILFHLP